LPATMLPEMLSKRSPVRSRMIPPPREKPGRVWAAPALKAQVRSPPGPAHGELAVVADAVGNSGLASTVGVEARLSCASVPGGRVDGSVPVEAHACDRAETSRSSHVVQRRRPTEATDRLASLRRDVRDAELVLALRAFAVAKAGCVERAREMD
jgi:hypothetical protein